MMFSLGSLAILAVNALQLTTAVPTPEDVVSPYTWNWLKTGF
jgi:hypothetical protein